MFEKEELAIIRSNLTAERIAVWIKDRNILDVKTVDHGAYVGKLGIVADSLLKALKTNADCAQLKILSTSKTFTRRIRAYLLHEVVPAVRNLRIGGSIVPQLLVLPAGTVAEPESLANALSLGEVPHEVAEGYHQLSRKKVKVDLVSHATFVKHTGSNLQDCETAIINYAVLRPLSDGSLMTVCTTALLVARYPPEHCFQIQLTLHLSRVVH
jgi:hypothetical protein